MKLEGLNVYIWLFLFGKVVRPGEKWYILCAIFMSHTRKTTRWRCFWAFCVTLITPAYCRTFINLISIHAGIIAAPPHIGHAHFCLNIFFASAQKLQNTTSTRSNYAPFSDSHETSHVASEDCLMKKSNWKYFDISQNKRAINISIYVNLTSKNQVHHLSTLVCRIDTKLWSIVPYTSIKHPTQF